MWCRGGMCLVGLTGVLVALANTAATPVASGQSSGGASTASAGSESPPNPADGTSRQAGAPVPGHFLVRLRGDQAADPMAAGPVRRTYGLARVRRSQGTTPHQCVASLANAPLCDHEPPDFTVRLLNF